MSTFVTLWNKGVFSDQQKAIHVQIQQKCDFDLITGDETYSIKGFIYQLILMTALSNKTPSHILGRTGGRHFPGESHTIHYPSTLLVSMLTSKAPVT